MAVLGAAALAAGGWGLGSDHPSGSRSAAAVPPSSIVTADTELDGTPIDAAAAPSALWVLTCIRKCSAGQRSSGGLVQVAAGSGMVIKRLPVDDPQALTISAGAIWIAHFETGTVTGVDPGNGRTTATVHLTLPGPKIDGDRRFLPFSISAGDDRIWVTTNRGWLAVIDSRTSRLAAMVPIPAESSGQAVVNADGIWVTESLAGVGFLAPNADRLAIRGITAAGQDVAVAGVAAGGGLVWAYGSFFNPVDSSPGEHYTGVVTAIDPRTGTIVRQLQVTGSDDSFAYGNGALYVADFEQGLVVRITPDFRVQMLLATPGSESLVAATPGVLWATTESGRLFRFGAIGRLRVRESRTSLPHSGTKGRRAGRCCAAGHRRSLSLMPPLPSLASGCRGWRSQRRRGCLPGLAGLLGLSGNVPGKSVSEGYGAHFRLPRSCPRRVRPWLSQRGHIRAPLPFSFRPPGRSGVLADQDHSPGMTRSATARATRAVANILDL